MLLALLPVSLLFSGSGESRESSAIEEETRRIVGSFDTAQAFRSALEGSSTLPVATQEGPRLSNPLAARVASALLQPGGFVIAHKRCGFDPYVGFRFCKGKQCVEAHVCFFCNDVEWVYVGPDGERREGAFGDVGAIRPVLLDAAVLAFPNDTALQWEKAEKDTYTPAISFPNGTPKGLDFYAVALAANPHRKEVRACAKKAGIVHQPHISVFLPFKGTLSASGRLENVQADGHFRDDLSVVSQCLLETMKSWRLPGGSNSPVSIYINL